MKYVLLVATIGLSGCFNPFPNIESDIAKYKCTDEQKEKMISYATNELKGYHVEYAIRYSLALHCEKK